jgi:hypothetical protein
MGLFDLFGGFGGFGGIGGIGGFGGFGGLYGIDSPGDLFGSGFRSYGLGYGSPYGTYDPYAPSSSSVVSAPGSESTAFFVADSRESGALRLKVKPDKASVYLDGHYVGLVSQYDGIFHKMRLDGGNHGIEIQAPGYQTLRFNVRIEPDHTETYRGELEKVVK